jgi:Ran GTPase-activating protein 1
MADNKFSLENKSLKLDSASDIAPYIEQLEKLDGLEAIDLSGNTFGVDACTALAEALKTKKSLKVFSYSLIYNQIQL